ncbi:hypothetical protein HNR68_000365 [Saccharopolyspora hordei]|uniref:Uncharacterized protein n=1 Tax=Saccharopolyspora hordei TaxID=1838 RepID=A0A853AC94_9PSEU|nr:hypothetical protein [Saccharopolyspora hordei]
MHHDGIARRPAPTAGVRISRRAGTRPIRSTTKHRDPRREPCATAPARRAA